MEQKTNHLKTGDLILIQQGWDKHLKCAVFCYSSDVSITFKSLYEKSHLHDYLDHIRTRNSTRQRVYKISIDNLTQEQLIIYKKVRRKVLQMKKEYEKTKKV